MSSQTTTTAREHLNSARAILARAIDACAQSGKPLPAQPAECLAHMNAAAHALDVDQTSAGSQPSQNAMLQIAITPTLTCNPPGKLADAEIHFLSGPLAGLKLIGFSIWERRSGDSRNVTFPARQYQVNGERRSFALLRPTTDSTAQDRIRQLILEAYEQHMNPPAAAPGEQTVTSRDGCTNQIVRPRAADLQEASTSPNPDPGILMHAMQQSAERLYPTPAATAPLIKARRF